jgi:hypothetical protein
MIRALLTSYTLLTIEVTPGVTRRITEDERWELYS